MIFNKMPCPDDPNMPRNKKIVILVIFKLIKIKR